MTTENTSALKEVPCDSCGSDRNELFLRLNDLAETENRDLVKCQDCGLIFVSPRKMKDYIVEGVGDYFDFHYDLGAFKYPYGILMRWTSPPGRFLDVGCGPGYMLDIARAHDWNTIGVELRQAFVEVGRKYLKLDIRDKTLQDCNFEDNSFDVVSMTEVIEHLPSPSTMLFEVHRVLKHNGRLLMTTPNIESEDFKRLKEKWHPQIFPEEHVYYFSQDTLRRMLEQKGFEVLDIMAAGGDHNDEQIIAVAAKCSHEEAIQQTSAVEAFNIKSARYRRLRRNWFFGLIMRLADILINYPEEAKKLPLNARNHDRYIRIEESIFFRPFIKIGNRILNDPKEKSGKRP